MSAHGLSKWQCPHQVSSLLSRLEVKGLLSGCLKSAKISNNLNVGGKSLWKGTIWWKRTFSRERQLKNRIRNRETTQEELGSEHLAGNLRTNFMFEFIASITQWTKPHCPMKPQLTQLCRKKTTRRLRNYYEHRWLFQIIWQRAPVWPH
jgi:hypothetical protein